MLESYARPGHCPRRPPDGTPSVHPTHPFHVIHIHVLIQANILVNKDSTPRISGLGNAYVLPHAAAWTVEGRTSNHRLSRCRAPELAGLGMSPNVTDAAHPTKASDMYAFGVMAWEVRIDSFEWHFLSSLTRDRFSREDPRSLR